MIGETWLKWADQQVLFGLDVWEFSLRSLLRPYGRLFLRSVLMRHPLRAMAGLRTYRRKCRPARDAGCALVGIPSWDELAAELAVDPWVVGLGFCEKPIEPGCPSGRANHRCWLLGQENAESLPAPCRQCAVREVSEHALPAGATVHVMTSASDFAYDVLLPSLRNTGPSRLVLSLCPYSAPPMTLAMSICGLRGTILSYNQGDCRDYATWVRADEGVKLEQTCLPRDARHRLLELLDQVAAVRAGQGQATPKQFREEGNFYVPVP